MYDGIITGTVRGHVFTTPLSQLHYTTTTTTTPRSQTNHARPADAYYANQTGDYGTEEHALRRLSVEMGISVDELLAMPIDDPHSLDLDMVDVPSRFVFVCFFSRKKRKVKK